MAVKFLYGLSGLLALPASSVATIIKVDAGLSGAIAASGFINGTDETYLAIYTNGAYEVVKVTHVNGQNLTVVRGISGTAQAFAAGANVKFELTSQAIIADIGPIESTVQITGSGLAVVTNPSLNNWHVAVASPQFTYDGGIEITGNYPNLAFHFTPQDCCGEESGEGEGGVTQVETLGIISASINGELLSLEVQPPQFGGSGGITITGSYPSYNISYSGGGGGGTVTSVTAGAGITVTGAPAVNPTVSITNTGVVAGTYGGIEIGADGRIIAVPATLNPVSIVNVSDPIEVARVDDAVTISVKDATVGQKGVVELSDDTDTFDPLDTTSAVSPAGVAAAMATLGQPALDGVDLYAGEIDGDYTNTIGASAVAIELAAGKKALVTAEVTMVDGATPLTPVAFGMAIFNTTPTKIKSNKKVTQSVQSMSFVVTGPVASTNWALVTTAVPGGASVVSYNLSILKLP